MPLGGTLRRALGSDLARTLADDLVRLGVDHAVVPRPEVTAEELAALPRTVQRYLRFSGVGPGPRQSTFSGAFHGRFRLAPGARWMPCDAVQFTRADPVARLFRMRLTMAGCLPIVALDSYVDGTGTMHADALGMVTVADAQGPELDLGELTSWVNDAVLYAPGLLLGSSTRWSSDASDRFEVAFTDHGTTVRAEVTVDERGAPVDFSSDDRYAALPGGMVRSRWRTPIGRWSVGRHSIPVGGSAVWELADGPFTYVEGEMDPHSIVIDGCSIDPT